MALPLFAPRRPAPSVLGGEHVAQARGREVASLVLWTFAVFSLLALASYETNADGVSVGQNWVGPVGEWCAHSVIYVVGVIAWAVPVEAVLLGIPFVRGKKSLITSSRIAGDLLVLILAAALVQVAWPGKLAFGHMTSSGCVGELFGELSRSLFSTIGSFIVGFACLGLILISRASFSFIALMLWFGRLGETSAAKTAHGAQHVAEAWKKARDLDREKREKEREAALPHIRAELGDDATIAVEPAEDEEDVPQVLDLEEEVEQVLVETPAQPKPKRKRKTDKAPIVDMSTNEKSPVTKADLKVEVAAEDADDPPLAPLVLDAPIEAPKVKKQKGPIVPTIVDTSAALEKEKVTKKEEIAAKKEEKKSAHAFKLPPFDFLIPQKIDPTLAVDREALLKNAELLIKTLQDYGVQGKVEDILPGPTVATFEVSPAAGTKVSKVASLADDLALALAKKVRIVAPIPGKNRIGFELPNEKRIPVSFRDLVEDRRFQTLDAPLPVVLGRDILGAPVYADLASMPHVIVAGATGAGKSVGLNVMLTSLLYRRSPEDLRLLMIDPKVVELAPFDRIPHMLLPVVTDMKQASNALKWAVDEMERRYQMFAAAGTKNIATYNNWVARVIAGEIKNPFPKVVTSKDHNGFTDQIAPEKGSDEGEAPLPEKLPLIVIVVDEFADLMMQQGKDVEAAVARLAQKARAAGMHVILATQRPSVDVITGMIKANFPTRIAYRVAQKVDSRTILDEQGAEHLLGRGDMLIKLNGTNETKRVQCPMITEEEVNAVTDFLRAQGEPVYDENILKPRDEDAAEEEDDAEQDAVYDDAVRIVADTRRCSTSWLQRKLGLGYNRAARIVEMMERRGLVGPSNGAKDREVLIDPI
jgi:S-DNA-T family DNA segregation ATPase FtsK/SpoIIIE